MRSLLVWAALGATNADAPPPASLAALVAEAETNNETQPIAEERVTQGAAAVRRAVASLLPEATLTGAYANRDQEARSGNAVFRASNALNAQMLLSMRILDVSQIPNIGSARAELEAREHDRDELVRRLRFDVALGFFGVLGTEGARDAAVERLRLAERTLSDISARFEAGLASRNDRSRTELEVASARLALTRADNAVRQARLGLGFLVGRPVDEPLLDVAEVPEVVDPGPETTRADRPDVRALQARIVAAERSALEPWLRMVPTIDAELRVTASNETGFQDDPFTRIVQLTATWALYDGGVRYADRRERTARARELDLTLAQLERGIRVDVESAQALLEAAMAAVRQADEQLRVADLNYQEVLDRFENGFATALEQADASVQRFEARVVGAEARFAERQAILQLMFAIGRASPLGSN